MAARPPKRLRQWVELAEQVRWTYDETSDGHPRLTPPADLINPSTGRTVAPITFGKTPSDSRGDSNTVAYLRRYGVPIPHKGRTSKKGER